MMTSRLPWMRCMTILLAIAGAQGSAAFAAQTPSSAKDESSEARFTIAGTVVNSSSGTPLDKARVSIGDVRSRQQEASLITSEDGHFEFKGLKAGKYDLRGAKRGYLSAAYNEHEQYSTAIVTGPEFDTEHLVLRLTPLAALSGTVYDELGEPVRGANVALYFKSTRAGMTRVTRAGRDTTDDQGYFEFPAMAPGEYFLSASAIPWYAVHPVTLSEPGTTRFQPNVAQGLDVVYPTTFYNGATDADAATPISVKAGDRVQADLHFSPVPALHLLYRTSEQQGSAVPSFQKRVFGSTEVMSSSAQFIAPGLWEVTGVPAGRYTVAQQQGAREFTEMVLSENGQELDAAHGEAAAQLKLKVNLPPGEEQPKQLSLALQDSRRQVVANKNVEGGEVSFEGIPPGKYIILAGSSDKPYTVARMTSQGTEISGHDVTLAPGASLELNLFLVGGVVRIEGFVKRGDKPAAGIMVALVPNPPSNLEILRRDQSDFDGSFTLHGVFRGSYTIVAVEDAWGTEWLQPEVLARYLRKGQNLTIGPLMKGSVHLPDPVQVQPK